MLKDLQRVAILITSVSGSIAPDSDLTSFRAELDAIRHSCQRKCSMNGTEADIQRCEPLSLEFDPNVCLENEQCQDDINAVLGEKELAQNFLLLNNTSRDSLSLGSALCSCQPESWCEGVFLMRMLARTCRRVCWKYLRDPFWEGAAECLPDEHEYDANLCKAIECGNMLSSLGTYDFQSMEYAMRPDLLNDTHINVWADLQVCMEARKSYHEMLGFYGEYIALILMILVSCISFYMTNPDYVRRQLQSQWYLLRGHVRDVGMEAPLVEAPFARTAAGQGRIANATAVAEPDPEEQ